MSSSKEEGITPKKSKYIILIKLARLYRSVLKKYAQNKDIELDETKEVKEEPGKKKRKELDPSDPMSKVREDEKESRKRMKIFVLRRPISDPIDKTKDQSSSDLSKNLKTWDEFFHNKIIDLSRLSDIVDFTVSKWKKEAQQLTSKWDNVIKTLMDMEQVLKSEIKTVGTVRNAHTKIKSLLNLMEDKKDLVKKYNFSIKNNLIKVDTFPALNAFINSLSEFLEKKDVRAEEIEKAKEQDIELDKQMLELKVEEKKRAVEEKKEQLALKEQEQEEKKIAEADKKQVLRQKQKELQEKKELEAKQKIEKQQMDEVRKKALEQFSIEEQKMTLFMGVVMDAKLETVKSRSQGFKMDVAVGGALKFIKNKVVAENSLIKSKIKIDPLKTYENSAFEYFKWIAGYESSYENPVVRERIEEFKEDFRNSSLPGTLGHNKMIVVDFEKEKEARQYIISNIPLEVPSSSSSSSSSSPIDQAAASIGAPPDPAPEGEDDNEFLQAAREVNPMQQEVPEIVFEFGDQTTYEDMADVVARTYNLAKKLFDDRKIVESYVADKYSKEKFESEMNSALADMLRARDYFSKVAERRPFNSTRYMQDARTRENMELAARSWIRFVSIYELSTGLEIKAEERYTVILNIITFFKTNQISTSTSSENMSPDIAKIIDLMKADMKLWNVIRQNMFGHARNFDTALNSAIDNINNEPSFKYKDLGSMFDDGYNIAVKAVEGPPVQVIYKNFPKSIGIETQIFYTQESGQQSQPATIYSIPAITDSSETQNKITSLFSSLTSQIESGTASLQDEYNVFLKTNENLSGFLYQEISAQYNAFIDSKKKRQPISLSPEIPATREVRALFNQIQSLNNQENDYLPLLVNNYITGVYSRWDIRTPEQITLKYLVMADLEYQYHKYKFMGEIIEEIKKMYDLWVTVHQTSTDTLSSFLLSSKQYTSVIEAVDQQKNMLIAIPPVDLPPLISRVDATHSLLNSFYQGWTNTVNTLFDKLSVEIISTYEDFVIKVDVDTFMSFAMHSYEDKTKIIRQADVAVWSILHYYVVRGFVNNQELARFITDVWKGYSLKQGEAPSTVLTFQVQQGEDPFAERIGSDLFSSIAFYSKRLPLNIQELTSDDINVVLNEIKNTRTELSESFSNKSSTVKRIKTEVEKANNVALRFLKEKIKDYPTGTGRYTALSMSQMISVWEPQIKELIIESDLRLKSDADKNKEIISKLDESTASFNEIKRSVGSFVKDTREITKRIVDKARKTQDTRTWVQNTVKILEDWSVFYEGDDQIQGVKGKQYPHTVTPFDSNVWNPLQVLISEVENMNQKYIDPTPPFIIEHSDDANRFLESQEALSLEAKTVIDKATASSIRSIVETIQSSIGFYKRIEMDRIDPVVTSTKIDIDKMRQYSSLMKTQLDASKGITEKTPDFESRLSLLRSTMNAVDEIIRVEDNKVVRTKQEFIIEINKNVENAETTSKTLRVQMDSSRKILETNKTRYDSGLVLLRKAKGSMDQSRNSVVTYRIKFESIEEEIDSSLSIIQSSTDNFKSRTSRINSRLPSAFNPNLKSTLLQIRSKAQSYDPSTDPALYFKIMEDIDSTYFSGSIRIKSLKQQQQKNTDTRKMDINSMFEYYVDSKDMYDSLFKRTEKSISSNVSDLSKSTAKFKIEADKAKTEFSGILSDIEKTEEQIIGRFGQAEVSSSGKLDEWFKQAVAMFRKNTISTTTAVLTKKSLDQVSAISQSNKDALKNMGSEYQKTSSLLDSAIFDSSRLSYASYTIKNVILMMKDRVNSAHAIAVQFLNYPASSSDQVTLDALKDLENVNFRKEYQPQITSINDAYKMDPLNTTVPATSKSDDQDNILDKATKFINTDYSLVMKEIDTGRDETIKRLDFLKTNIESSVQRNQKILNSSKDNTEVLIKGAEDSIKSSIKETSNAFKNKQVSVSDITIENRLYEHFAFEKNNLRTKLTTLFALDTAFINDKVSKSYLTKKTEIQKIASDSRTKFNKISQRKKNYEEYFENLRKLKNSRTKFRAAVTSFTSNYEDYNQKINNVNAGLANIEKNLSELKILIGNIDKRFVLLKSETNRLIVLINTELFKTPDIDELVNYSELLSKIEDYIQRLNVASLYVGSETQDMTSLLKNSKTSLESDIGQIDTILKTELPSLEKTINADQKKITDSWREHQSVISNFIQSYESSKDVIWVRFTSVLKTFLKKDLEIQKDAISKLNQLNISGTVSKSNSLKRNLSEVMSVVIEKEKEINTYKTSQLDKVQPSLVKKLNSTRQSIAKDLESLTNDIDKLTVGLTEFGSIPPDKILQSEIDFLVKNLKSSKSKYQHNSMLTASDFESYLKKKIPTQFPDGIFCGDTYVSVEMIKLALKLINKVLVLSEKKQQSEEGSDSGPVAVPDINSKELLCAWFFVKSTLELLMSDSSNNTKNVITHYYRLDPKTYTSSHLVLVKYKMDVNSGKSEISFSDVTLSKSFTQWNQAIKYAQKTMEMSSLYQTEDIKYSDLYTPTWHTLVSQNLLVVKPQKPEINHVPLIRKGITLRKCTDGPDGSSWCTRWNGGNTIKKFSILGVFNGISVILPENDFKAKYNVDNIQDAPDMINVNYNSSRKALNVMDFTTFGNELRFVRTSSKKEDPECNCFSFYYTSADLFMLMSSKDIQPGTDLVFC